MNYPVPMHAPLFRQPDPAEILAPLGLPLTPAVSAFARDLAPTDDDRLEEMACRSRAMTRRHFGRTVRLFAPLYLSNECINSCSYCGFSRENAILRVTLEAEEVRAEARHLAVNARPPRARMLQLLEDHDAAPLAQHEAVARGVERP